MNKLLKTILYTALALALFTTHAMAARLFTSGWELNSTGTSVEITTNSGPVTVSTTNVRSGTYAGRSTAGNGFWRQVISTSNQTTVGYIGVAIYVVAYPNASTQLVRWSDISNNPKGNITMTSTGTLVLLNTAGSQIGSASSAIPLNTWTYVELKSDASTTPGTLEGRVNGSVFATGNNSANSPWARALVGVITGTQTTDDIYFDDWKVNDSTGSAQTSYPGSGNVVIVRPNGAGESTQWSITGSSPAATNWQGVNEVTPNDAVTENFTNVVSKEDLFTLQSSGLHSYDTVNVVQYGVRFDNDIADATSAFKVEIEKASGGTKQQGTAIIPNSITWASYPAGGDIPTLTAYTDPDGAAWVGGGTLDTMRIGVLSTAIGVNKLLVSTLYAYIDYTPGTPAGNVNHSFLFFF